MFFRLNYILGDNKYTYTCQLVCDYYHLKSKKIDVLIFLTALC